MTRKAYDLKPYLERQSHALKMAQEAVFPDKRDLLNALGCTYAMYYNYSNGKAVIQMPWLYNRRQENPDLVPFVECYQKHLWGIGG